MFEFLKTAYTPEQAVEMFISQVAQRSEELSDPWLASFIGGLSDAGVSQPQIQKILNGLDFKLLLFAALCAMEALAIRNLFTDKEAVTLYDSLNQKLQSAIPGEPLGELVFSFLGQMWKQDEDEFAMPNVSAAFSMMEIMGLRDHVETEHLFHNPSFVMRISVPLVQFVLGWWKTFRDNARLKLASRQPTGW